MAKRKQDDTAVADSSGNVFADLGLPHGEVEMLKISVAMAISKTIQKRGLTQSQAAKIVGTDQAKMSALMRGVLKGFTVERLMGFLVRLGRDIEIKIGSAKDTAGKIKIRSAA